MKKIIIIALAVLVAVSASAARPRQYTDRSYSSPNGLSIPYKVLFPKDFDRSESYPLLLFLHGAGERGSDNQAQTVHGGRLLATDKQLRDVIVIVPQCPESDYWAPTENGDFKPENFPENAEMMPSLAAVKELLEGYIATGLVKTDRIYCTGLSMGGMGTLDFALRFPDFFAAVQPVCGGVNIERCRQYKGRTAFRFFHGEDDPVVDCSCSLRADEALRQAGAESSVTTYPGVKHGSWYNAFEEEDFIGWLLKH
ncbi:MAG: dienelactone hydrolase family protein [Bacteroidales bacterium]|nr:dienelactone hydrolase family protein [Bacteroidales bacterium]